MFVGCVDGGGSDEVGAGAGDVLYVDSTLTLVWRMFSYWNDGLGRIRKSVVNGMKLSLSVLFECCCFC